MESKNVQNLQKAVEMLQKRLQLMESNFEKINSDNISLKKENEMLKSKADIPMPKPIIPKKDEPLKFNFNEIIYHLKHSPNFTPPFINIDIQKELQEILGNDKYLDEIE